jgi:hypothetical protein
MAHLTRRRSASVCDVIACYSESALGQRLNSKCDNLLSTFASNSNLCRYRKEDCEWVITHDESDPLVALMINTPGITAAQIAELEAVPPPPPSLPSPPLLPSPPPYVAGIWDDADKVGTDRQ